MVDNCLNENAYRLLFEAASEVTLVIDPGTGVILDASSSAARALEYSLEELIGMPVDRVQTPMADGKKEGLEKKLADRGQAKFEHSFCRRDGSTFPVAVSSRLLSLDGRTVVVSTVRDISLQVQSTLELARREMELRAALYGIGDAVICVDIQGRVVRMNPAAESLTGWSEGEAKGRPVTMVLKLTYEETRQQALVPFGPSFVKAISGGYTRRLLVAHRQGEEVPVTYTASPIFSPEGDVTSTILLFHNRRNEVFARRFADARLALIDYAESHTLEELLQRVLDRVEPLVRSRIGFFHFVEPDQNTLSLQQWSTQTLEKFCRAEGSGMHYPISQAGVWVDGARERKPVIHNDYESLPHRKGMPPGHARVIRQLVVPVIRRGAVVAILGVGNKPSDYTDEDVDIVSYFADLTWDIIQKKRDDAEIALQKEIEVEMSRLSSLLLTTTDITEISERVLDTAKKLTRSRYGFVGSYDDDTGRFVSHTMTRDVWQECDVPEKSVVFEKCTGLFGWVLENRQPAMVNHLKGDPRSSGTPEGHIPIEAFLGVPAMIGDRVVGEIALANPENRYMDIDLTIAERLATLFAMAIQRQEYETELLEFEARKAAELERQVEERTADLSKSQKLLEAIFSSQMDAILVLDDSRPSRIQDCNPAAEALFGYNCHEMTGQDTGFLHPDKQQETRFQEVLSSRLKQNAKLRFGDFFLKRKDAAILPVEISLSRLPGEDGRNIGWVAAIRDISEQKAYESALRQSEEKFKAIADYTMDWESWIDKDGRLLWVNPAVERLTGHTPDELMAMESLQEWLGAVLHHEDRDKALNMVESGLANRSSLNDRHLRIQRQDGEVRWISLSCHPIYGVDGTWLGLRSSMRDITERKLAREAVKKSEARFKAFMDRLPAAAFIQDSEVRFLFFNQYMAEQFGADDSWIGKPPDRLFPVDPARRMIQSSKQALETGICLTEESLRSVEGKTLEFQAVKFTLSGSEQETLVGGIAWDTTEQARSRRRLEESEARFRELFNNMTSGIAIYDSMDDGQSFVFKDMNRTGEKISKVSASDVIGRNVADVFPNIEAMGLLDVFRRVWRTGRSMHLSGSLYNDGRVEFWVDNDVFRLPSGELVAIYDDVTAEKKAEADLARSEERLKLALDSVSDAVWDWNIATGETYFSSRWYTMIGYEPYELPQTFETWEKLLHPDDLEPAKRVVMNHLNRNKPFETEFRLRTKDGNWRWILGRGKAVSTGPDGAAVRMLGTHMDLTERKQIESRLRQSQKMEAMGTLAGGIAHDFNNILAAIIGYAELVMDTVPEGSKASGRLDGIISASERARELISQILTFSRKSDKELQIMDIRPIIKEALALIRASLPSTIRIDQQIHPDLPVILGDPTQIHQVIMNLSTNAAHAMRQGGVMTVELTTVNLDNGFIQMYPDLTPGEYILLTVTDDGCGIPASILPSIFDPFFTTKKKGEGTGLGLSVVHGIVKEYGGEIVVESREGEGTRVNVYLPALRQEKADALEKNVTVPLGGERILVVDDEEVLSIIVQDMLENLGYTVTSMTDSTEAFQAFTEAPDAFDIVLLDVTMPGMTGIDMARECHRIRPDIPMILWSGNEAPLSPDFLEEIGVSRMMTKPFRQNDLAKSVREVLDRHAEVSGKA